MAVISVKHDRNNGAPQGSASIDIDAVAIMRGCANRRVPVHDQRLVVIAMPVELLPDPDQIVLVLLVQRNAGANARMNEDHPVFAMPERKGRNKLAVRVRHKGSRLREKRRGILRNVTPQPIGGKRRLPSHAGAQPEPGILNPFRGIGVAQQKLGETPVVIAAEHDPVLAAHDAVDQELDDAPRIRPAIHEVADMHDSPGRASGPRTVLGDQGMRRLQVVEMSVDVPDRINHRALTSLPLHCLSRRASVQTARPQRPRPVPQQRSPGRPRGECPRSCP